MAITSLDISVNFFINKTSSFFVITDRTDYSAQGVTPADVKGLVTVIAPGGIHYTNSDWNNPDFDLSAGDRTNRLITIPTYIGTNNPVQGAYEIEFTFSDDDGATSFDTSKLIDFYIDKPTPILDITVDCISPELKSEDKTNFNIRGVNPTTSASITFASSGNDELGVNGDLTGAYTIGNKVHVVGSQSNNGTYTITDIQYNLSTNRTILSFSEAVPSNTVGGLLYTRTNTIYYPSVLGLNPIVGHTNTISTNTFYTGNQEFKSEGYYYYNFSNYSVTFYLEITKSKEVTCDIRLCDIYCCISKTLNNYFQYKGVNDVLANNYKNAYVLACSYLTSLQTQLQCGNSTNIDKVVAEIRAVTGCTTDCNCETSDNVLIQGSGSSSNVDVVSGSNQLKVVPTVSGNTTTFTLTLDQALINALANIVSVTLVDSGNIEVNEVIDGNGNKTYTPTVKASAIPTVREQMSFTLLIQYRNATAPFNATPSVGFTVSNLQYVAQSDFSTPTIQDKALASLNYPECLNLIAIQNWQASSDAYKVYAEVVRTVGFNSQNNTITSSSDLELLNWLGINFVKQSTNEIVFTISNETLSSPTQKYLTDNYQSVLINFLITK